MVKKRSTKSILNKEYTEKIKELNAYLRKSHEIYDSLPDCIQEANIKDTDGDIRKYIAESVNLSNRLAWYFGIDVDKMVVEETIERIFNMADSSVDNERKMIEENRVINSISKEEFITRMRFLGWCCYQIAAGQEYNTIPNKDQYDSLLQGTIFGLQNLGMTPEENHENWMRCKTEQGWVYGEVKDFKNKTHPDLVPFDQLPKVEADKDIMDCMMVKELSDFYDKYINNESQ